MKKSAQLLGLRGWSIGALILAVVITFPATQGEMLNFDDNRYVQDNPLLEDFSWSATFGEFYDGHYHPVTILSLALDRQLGMEPVKAHHLSNWLLHLANGALLFLLLSRLFPQQRKAALLAALLFSIHPVAVESYAWMSERKNVLYSFFFLLSALGYENYRRRGNGIYLALALLLFCLSLLSKAQAVALLPVFFLIDYSQGVNWRQPRLYLEKLPVLLLSLLFILLTRQAQDTQWIGDGLAQQEVWERFFMASWAFTRYFAEALLPLQLSPFHPYPDAVGQQVGGFLFLAPLAFLLFGAALYWSYRRDKLLFFALLFFFVNVVLLLKFTPYPQGNYFMAHRYNYLPAAGLAFGLAHLLFRYGPSGNVRVALIALLCTGYGLGTRSQLQTWNNSTALWETVVERYPGYSHGHNMLGLAYLAEGQGAKGVQHFQKVIELDPQLSDGHANLAVYFLKTERYQQALDVLEKGRETMQDRVNFFLLRTRALRGLKRHQKAMTNLEEALERWPKNQNLIIHKTQVMIEMGQLEKAEKWLAQRAQSKRAKTLLDKIRQRIQQNDPQQQQITLLQQKGTELLKNGEPAQAARVFTEVLELDSRYYFALLNRASAYGSLGKMERALEDARKALEVEPEKGEAYALYGSLLYDAGQREKACRNFEQSIRYGYNLPEHLRKRCR